MKWENNSEEKEQKKAKHEVKPMTNINEECQRERIGDDWQQASEKTMRQTETQRENEGENREKEEQKERKMKKKDDKKEKQDQKKEKKKRERERRERTEARQRQIQFQFQFQPQRQRMSKRIELQRTLEQWMNEADQATHARENQLWLAKSRCSASSYTDSVQLYRNRACFMQ